MHRKLFQDSRFSFAKSNVDMQRSTFDLSHGHHLSMNAGMLVPFFIQEVLPGDTFQFSDAFVARTTSPPVAPVMDTSMLDQWLFYVPWRLVWEHTREFFGENRVSSWENQTDYFIPQMSTDGFKENGLADYFGIPTKVSTRVNALPFRAYREIWNEWFRDQNTQDPVLVDTSDNGGLSSDLDQLLPVNKRKDYFTTCLPEPQKGPDVLLPLSGLVPVVTGPGSVLDITGTWHDNIRMTYSYGGSANTFLPLGIRLYGDGSEGQFVSDADAERTNFNDYGVGFDNLFSDLSYGATTTINQLRQAFAVQSLYELDARGGSRYREFLKAHFGVSVPDLTVQVPEFLAGMSTPINVSQVIQTSATQDGVSAQGNAGAFSKTTQKGASSFTKSFTEPGYIIGVCAIRTLHSYQQGLNRMWSRTSRLDVYHPVLAHIGEQPVFNKEIYLQAHNNPENDEVFGYQEAFAEYRYNQSYVSGAFRSNYSKGSLDYWTYTDDFDGVPRLSDEFIRETDANISRTLSFTDADEAPQFIVDFWFNLLGTRVMPVHGTPAMLGGRQ